MATKSKLLKLSKIELIKKCKKKKIDLPLYATKSQLIDLILKRNNQQKLAKLKSTSNLLHNIDIIPYEISNTNIKGVCHTLQQNHVLLEQTRIRGAYKIRKNIVIYNSKSQQFKLKYDIKFTQKYSLDRIYIYGINKYQNKLYALWRDNTANYTFKRLIEYNLIDPHWTEIHDLPITFDFRVGEYQPHILITSDTKTHIFKYISNKGKLLHMIWDKTYKTLQKYAYHPLYDNIFYDERLDIMIMILFEYDQYKQQNQRKVVIINIFWSKIGDYNNQKLNKIKWNKAIINCQNVDYKFDPNIDRWCIVNGTYFVIFYHDQSIKYIDFIARNKWRICNYKLPEKLITIPKSKFSTHKLFVTDDEIIHHFKNVDGCKVEHYKMKLKYIDQRLSDNINKWMVFVYGFLFDCYQPLNYSDIVRLICQYCFVSYKKT